MSYRTAPEKPVKISIQLTDEELHQAVRDYCQVHKSMEIPSDLTNFSVRDFKGDQRVYPDVRFYNFEMPAKK